MTTQNFLETKLRSELNPIHLEVSNESHLHNVQPGSESHFSIVIVSDDFAGMSLIARHRAVQAFINMDQHGIHALALHTYTANEWPTDTTDTQSPKCLGGARK